MQGQRVVADQPYVEGRRVVVLRVTARGGPARCAKVAARGRPARHGRVTAFGGRARCGRAAVRPSSRGRSAERPEGVATSAAGSVAGAASLRPTRRCTSLTLKVLTSFFEELPVVSADHVRCWWGEPRQEEL